MCQDRRAGELLVCVLLALILIGTAWVLRQSYPQAALAPQVIELQVAPAPRGKATLEDVRRDWGIQGRLDCRSVLP